MKKGKTMREEILFSANQAIEVSKLLATNTVITFIDEVSTLIAGAFAQGKKVMVAGNGGSLCDAMHCAEEFTGFYRKKRNPLPAMAFSDPGVMSCISNDAGFEYVFSRQVEAFGKEGDIFIVLTTSGNSKNLVEAVKVAKKKGVHTVAFLGKTGGSLKAACDFEWIVEGYQYSDRIQEVQMASIHIIIEMVEKKLKEHHSELLNELLEDAHALV